MPRKRNIKIYRSSASRCSETLHELKHVEEFRKSAEIEECQDVQKNAGKMFRNLAGNKKCQDVQKLFRN